jgi:hypothetical protein
VGQPGFPLKERFVGIIFTLAADERSGGAARESQQFRPSDRRGWGYEAGLGTLWGGVEACDRRTRRQWSQAGDPYPKGTVTGPGTGR